MQHSSRTKSGFTLVELVVVAPLIILLIGAVVGSIVFLTGSSMRAQAKAQLQHDVLEALDQIDTYSADSVDVSESTSEMVYLTNLATKDNPRKKVEHVVSGSCEAADGSDSISLLEVYNLTYKVIPPDDFNNHKYQLIQDTALPSNTCYNKLWQLNNRAILIDNAKNIVLEVSKVAPSNPPALDIKLTVTRQIGGKDIVYTGYLRTKSPNSH